MACYWTSAALASDRIVLMPEIIQDRNAPPGRGADFGDATLLGVHGLAHASITFGSFAPGGEVGWAWQDGRRCNYGAMLRRRSGGMISDTALQLHTDQVLGRAVCQVSLMFLWPDHPEERNVLAIPSLGAALYYSGLTFASVRAVLDPRPGTGLTFRLAERLGWSDGHVEVALAPRTDGVVNYSLQVRWRWLLAGYAQEDDFDFSRIDRRVFSLGVLYDLGS